MKCEICGQAAEADDLIWLAGRRVCAVCKPNVVQRLVEGVSLRPVASLDLANAEFGLRQLITRTWAILRQDWVAIGSLTLLTSILTNLVLIGIREPESVAALTSFITANVLLEVIFGVIASLGSAYIVSEHLQGRYVSFDQALRHAFSRWLRGVGTSLVELLITGLLCLAFIVPGLIWAVYYSFAIYVVSLREESGLRALEYSKKLVRGRWWRIVGRLLALFAISLVAGLPFYAALGLAPDSKLLEFVLNTVTTLPFAFFTVGSVVLFLNLDALARKAP